VLQHGRRLGLAGRARNLPDGRVEVWACGPRQDLEALALVLHQGPMMSQVPDVKVEWGIPCPVAAGFEVR
jgi:acylphosphatase